MFEDGSIIKIERIRNPDNSVTTVTTSIDSDGVATQNTIHNPLEEAYKPLAEVPDPQGSMLPAPMVADPLPIDPDPWSPPPSPPVAGPSGSTFPPEAAPSPETESSGWAGWTSSEAEPSSPEAGPTKRPFEEDPDAPPDPSDPKGKRKNSNVYSIQA